MAVRDFDYHSDLRRYVPNPDEKAVSAIVRFCGIALKGLDSRWVSASDDSEIKRVVDGFCAKKLGLDGTTARSAVAAVADQMKADRTKHRLTFYYLLAEHTKTLSKLA